mmetsp:Transcript_45583/g.73301  ORF Transcript_45583/g.73301 Transcript_45583/m.73301 type:complete len:200 (+) Transcript_45583:977-1576(+)
MASSALISAPLKPFPMTRICCLFCLSVATAPNMPSSSSTTSSSSFFFIFSSDASYLCFPPTSPPAKFVGLRYVAAWVIVRGLASIHLLRPGRESKGNFGLEKIPLVVATKSKRYERARLADSRDKAEDENGEQLFFARVRTRTTHFPWICCSAPVSDRCSALPSSPCSPVFCGSGRSTLTTSVLRCKRSLMYECFAMYR